MTHRDPMTDEETAAREREGGGGCGLEITESQDTRSERGAAPVIFRGVHTVSDVHGGNMHCTMVNLHGQGSSGAKISSFAKVLVRLRVTRDRSMSERLSVAPILHF